MTDTLVTAAQLAAACGSQTWVQQMSRQLPIVSFTDLRAAADAAFDILTDADWLEAFAHHPRIGDVAALRERFAASGALSEREQAGLADADDLVIEQLASGNDLYEQRFGFVYLIRAAGRSPHELLAAQQERLQHDRATELRIAAEQQREITHLRLTQFVAENEQASDGAAAMEH